MSEVQGYVEGKLMSVLLMMSHSTVEPTTWQVVVALIALVIVLLVINWTSSRNRRIWYVRYKPGCTSFTTTYHEAKRLRRLHGGKICKRRNI